jgi:hypothetical protein
MANLFLWFSDVRDGYPDLQNLKNARSGVPGEWFPFLPDNPVDYAHKIRGFWAGAHALP